MTDTRIENINIASEERIISPSELKNRFPLTEKAVQTVGYGQKSIKNILDRTDPRLFIVVGPCSIHDVEAAKAYAQNLKVLAEEVKESLLLVMRVYFEKPRTRIGWQGLINDPYIDNSGQLEHGLQLGRNLLLDIAEIGLPAAGEALDLVTPQYVQDLISWTAIGARTTESQSHRKMASGFTSAVGFKNGTDGNLEVAVNAMHAASHPSHFLSVNPDGNVAVIRTQGNPYSHIVLRGGGNQTNYDADSIAQCEMLLKDAQLPSNIMIDCSHGNSQKNHSRQLDVLNNVAQQIEQGNQSIISLMLESNLHAGNQPIPDDLSYLQYGVSITDACINWNDTREALLAFAKKIKPALHARSQ